MLSILKYYEPLIDFGLCQKYNEIGAINPNKIYCLIKFELNYFYILSNGIGLIELSIGDR